MINKPKIATYPECKKCNLWKDFRGCMFFSCIYTEKERKSEDIKYNTWERRFANFLIGKKNKK